VACVAMLLFYAFGDGDFSATVPRIGRLLRSCLRQPWSSDKDATRALLVRDDCTRNAQSQVRCDRYRRAALKRATPAVIQDDQVACSAPMRDPRNLHSQKPSFVVEFSPCTGGDSGSQSLASSDVGRIGGEEVLGNVLGWQRRMVAEGSRSSTIILRITQQISYLTFGEPYWTHILFDITTRSQHCILCLLSTLGAALVPGQIQQ